MVASNEGGLLQFGSKHGGGNKEAEKVAIYGNSLRALNECKNCIQRMSQEYKVSQADEPGREEKVVRKAPVSQE